MYMSFDVDDWDMWFLGYPTFMTILRVDGLSMDPRVLGCHKSTNSFTIRLITHMQLIVKHFRYHIFKSICTFVISFQGYTHSIYSLQVYLVITIHLKYEYNFSEQRTNNA